jgi:hypothetical protein
MEKGNCELCGRKNCKVYADCCNNIWECENCYSKICDEANCMRELTTVEELQTLHT